MEIDVALAYVAWIWMGVAVVTFVVLLWIAAPYGRHVRAGWGPTIPNHLGWMIMELPGLLIMPTLFLLGPVEKSWMHWLALGLYVGHYVHRALIFPFQLQTKGKRMPVAIMGSAIFFNLVNTSLMGTWLGWVAAWPPDWGLDWRFLAGLGLMALGVWANVDSDYRLLRLRSGGQTGYLIPHGGLFRWISCPNHAGEMLEWCGYALLCWGLAPATFAVWTVANLLPRALAHHRWYREKFADYPVGRKAVVPGVW